MTNTTNIDFSNEETCAWRSHGNAALREALDDILEIAKIALTVNTFGNSNNSELWKIIDKCRTALAAPAGNCDKYSTAEDCRVAYLKGKNSRATNYFPDYDR